MGQDEIFASCGFCEASIYVNKAVIYFHYWIKPTFEMEDAHLNLRRWMAGDQTIDGLQKNAVTKDESFTYFPVWRFVVKIAGEEQIFVEPAIPTSITEFRNLDLPAGLLSFAKPGKKEDEKLPDVEIDVNSAREWLREREIDPRLVSSISLVHIPVYRFTYEYENCLYTAVVEAATGNVIANVYPNRRDTPFIIVTLLSAFLFFCVGMSCPNFSIRFLAMLIAAVPAGFAAFYVQKKY